MPKLTDKQKRFIDEYLIDLNATRAAIRAGYSEKTAYRIGAELLQKTSIQSHLSERMNDRTKRTEITQDKILCEFAHTAFDNIGNYLSFKTDDKRQAVLYIKDSATIDTRNISEITVGKDGQFKFKLYSKHDALVQLGRHLGLFDLKQQSIDIERQKLNLAEQKAKGMYDIELEVNTADDTETLEVSPDKDKR